MGGLFSRHIRMSGTEPRGWLRISAAVLTAATVAACAMVPKGDLALKHVPLIDAAREPTATVTAPYRFAAGDELDVKFADSAQFDQTAKVLPDGKIILNGIGALDVAGHSVEEVQTDVRARFKTLAGADIQREYLIHANDELQVKLPYYPPLNDQIRVRPDGKIQLQLAGTLQAEGRTPEELEADLAHRYARYLKEPAVTVILLAATSQNIRTASGIGRGGLAGAPPVIMVRSFQTPQVFVTGEVTRAGAVPYTPGLTLLQALASAGGNMPSGDVTKLVILRRGAADSADVLRPNLTGTYRSAPTRDFVLQPFDVVILPPTQAQTLAESLDRYVYKLFAPLKNSSLSYVFGRTRTY